MRGIHRIPCGNVNCYLVQGEESAVLVDTGYTGYVERLLDTCLGAGVRLIVLTHGHLDHIQNTALLMERLGVPVTASRPRRSSLLHPQWSCGKGTAWPPGVWTPGFWSCPAIRRAPSAWTWRGTPSLWGTP